MTHLTRAAFGAALVTALCGCFPVPPNIPSSPKRFDAREMEGTWYMIATNFPSWTGTSNTDAHLSYKLRSTPDGVVELDDLVAFKSDGDPASYAGFDTQDPANDAHFTWRGNGFLALFPTEWYVAIVGPRHEWMVTYYGDTPKEEIDAALAAIAKDPVLKEKSRGIRRVFLYGKPKGS